MGKLIFHKSFSVEVMLLKIEPSSYIPAVIFRRLRPPQIVDLLGDTLLADHDILQQSSLITFLNQQLRIMPLSQSITNSNGLSNHTSTEHIISLNTVILLNVHSES